MSWHNIKRRKPDILFSNYIREKAKWRCEYCNKLCKIDGQSIYQLEASHYWSRRHESVRYDPRNVHALCANCHRNLGGYTRNENGEYDLWMKEKLGEKEYKLLKLEANRSGKKDDKLAIIYIKELMKEL